MSEFKRGDILRLKDKLDRQESGRMLVLVDRQAPEFARWRAHYVSVWPAGDAYSPVSGVSDSDLRDRWEKVGSIFPEASP